ncbi:Holliday junction resolvase RuvX [Alicyclobacillaceae bacterium I2511]|jgi:putative Holliday junction resolvase|nr:Holliday junction resolvase RuvX [Alicyclobacillaceae bacterium I2511]
MRILGVDYGTVRIGLSLSDPSGILAHSLKMIHRLGDAQAAREIAEVVRGEQVEKIVVGLPRHMNGEEGERAQQCRDFARRLENLTRVSVDMYDERLTSVQAERVLIAADVSRKRRKQVVDAMAATLLLQGYLDGHRETRADS